MVGLRISVDTGGTFTDVVVATGDREVISKAPTTSDRILIGMRDQRDRTRRRREDRVSRNGRLPRYPGVEGGRQTKSPRLHDREG